MGPTDAVLAQRPAHEVIGCVLHAAMVKALSGNCRFYPASWAGAPIAAYYLASELQDLADTGAMRRRAARLLTQYAPQAAEWVLLGTPEVTA